MDGYFNIVDVIPLGDPDSGESHIITLHHHCKEGSPGIATVQFGKFRAGERVAKCSDCSATTVVIKRNGGDIFIQQDSS